jgi:Ca-activated chloride channel family protein
MKNVKIFSLGIAMLFLFLNFKTINPLFSFQKKVKTITGIVSDNLGPLAGVSVLIKGTTTGTTTDFDGKYSIQASEGQSLKFIYTGMKTKIVKVSKSNIINVILHEGVLKADDYVVVSAYYTKKEKAPSSGTINKRRDSRNYTHPNTSFEQVLNGQARSLTVQAGSGNIQNNNSVKLRGTSSILENQNPLFLLNGEEISQIAFSNLNSNNIKSVTVLKEDAATQLYGVKAKDGLIFIELNDNSPKVDKKVKKMLLEINALQVAPTEEDYDSFVENPFTNPKYEALSTFSIDVDNASYTNIRRFINQGQVVPKDAVRVEEMVNFFNYNYNQPINEHPFSINTEYSDCPWNENHKLLKIGLQGKEIPTDNLPNSNFVFLIDVSGSMNQQNKLPLLKESMKVLVKEMRKNDKVAIVVYAGAAGLVLPSTSGNQKETIIKALDQLQAGGSTAGGAGIELAYKIAEENFIKGGNNRVILATDGDFNVGASSNSDMEKLIEKKRKSGVFLTCLGYGMGNYKDSKMEILADKGNGNYAYIDNIQEANRFLGKEFKGSMFAIAKDVKIQIEFNSKHVQNYRLIGYENRKLRPEDFKNDAIDAGELGSGHTVTALYEIIPLGVKSDYAKDIDTLKYSNTNSNNTFSEELATIKFRYKKPDGDKSIEMVNVVSNQAKNLQQASEDFKFSTAVAWFGLKLRDSKLIDKTSKTDIKSLAIQGKSYDNEGYKAEFIRLIEAVN